MKTFALVAALLSALTVGSSIAEAKPGGCLKYGLAGAVAGHYAGHHAFKGAVAGCMAGIARRHAYERHLKEQQEQQKAAPDQAPAASAPDHSNSDQGQKY